MTPFFAVGIIVLAVAQLLVPRRYGLIPLLIAALHFPNVSVLGVGAYDFSITRLIIGLCILRAVLGRDLAGFPKHKLDHLVCLWAGVAIVTSFAHVSSDRDPLVFAMGLIYNVGGAYLCARIYLRSPSDIQRFAGHLAIALLPLAFFMIVEKVSVRDVYSILGGVGPEAMVREGKVRARGPFVHPILAGTAGTTCVFLVCILWRQRRALAFAGVCGCVAVALCSASSGPILSFISGVAAMVVWRWREDIKSIRLGVLMMLVVLHVVMKAPVWYLIARLDVVGGSTGWHRAELINAGITHFHEWWLVGTDYTVHWMPTGASWSPNHTDITNHYLQMGIWGGMPLMCAFIAILVRAFSLLGKRMKRLRTAESASEWTLWLIGCALFSHTLTFLSVSYFDQVNVLFCLVLGCVPGACAKAMREREPARSRERYPASSVSVQVAGNRTQLVL